MSILFRNSRFNRSYLSRVVEAGAPEKKAPGQAHANGKPHNGQPSNGHPHDGHPRNAHQHSAAQQAGAHGRPKPVAPPVRVNAKEMSVLEICHPDIARAIELLWGFPEMNDYFDRLWIADDTHGPIDPDAMSDLMLLARVHQILMPERPNRSLASIYGSNRLLDPRSANDPWGDVPPRR